MKNEISSNKEPCVGAVNPVEKIILAEEVLKCLVDSGYGVIVLGQDLFDKFENAFGDKTG